MGFFCKVVVSELSVDSSGVSGCGWSWASISRVFRLIVVGVGSWKSFGFVEPGGSESMSCVWSKGVSILFVMNGRTGESGPSGLGWSESRLSNGHISTSGFFGLCGKGVEVDWHSVVCV